VRRARGAALRLARAVAARSAAQGLRDLGGGGCGSDGGNSGRRFGDRFGNRFGNSVGGARSGNLSGGLRIAVGIGGDRGAGVLAARIRKAA
jgi:hypothetical protein